MALSISEQFAAVAAALGVGTLLGKGVDLWVARGRAKRQEPADLIRSLSELSDTLSEGGQVTMPLEKQMWGDEFGMCVDRFGIQWLVNIGQPQA